MPVAYSRHPNIFSVTLFLTIAPNLCRILQLGSSIPTEILDDLCSRFLINIPDTERTDLVRLCFQLELAHWFYLDFYVDKDSSSKDTQCKAIGYREFARVLFAHCPFLQPIKDKVDEAIDQWRNYKAAVPTYGAILLDEKLEQVLLVQGFYAKSSWGFPKGKVNEDESPHDCAIREVLEETGFDISPLISQTDYLEMQMHETITRLYLIPYVPPDFDFQPQTRNEIKKIQWFQLADLPCHIKDRSKESIGKYPNHFYTILKFVESIRQWAMRKRSADKGNLNRNQARHAKKTHSDNPGHGRQSSPSSFQARQPKNAKPILGRSQNQRNQRNQVQNCSPGPHEVEPGVSAASDRTSKHQHTSSGEETKRTILARPEPIPQLGVIESAKAWVNFSLNWDKILPKLDTRV